jgi:hypothetical protein
MNREKELARIDTLEVASIEALRILGKIEAISQEEPK